VNPIDAIFTNKQHKALISYVTVGYPSIEATLKVAPILAEAGCDLIELGIPFSDPLADGATIQNASFHALQNGITVKTCLETAQKLSKQVKIPLVFMTYLNPILQYGFDAFCKACEVSGVSGLIIPDLPPEEGEELEAAAHKHNINVIYLLAPTSTEQRINTVAGRAGGFIYLVSVTGVTGTRTALPPDLKDFVTRVRKATDKPLCVGFGISIPEQAAEVAQIADGVIIGSRIIRLMEEDSSLNGVGRFIREVRAAIDNH